MVVSRVFELQIQVNSYVGVYQRMSKPPFFLVQCRPDWARYALDPLDVVSSAVQTLSMQKEVQAF